MVSSGFDRPKKRMFVIGDDDDHHHHPIYIAELVLSDIEDHPISMVEMLKMNIDCSYVHWLERHPSSTLLDFCVLMRSGRFPNKSKSREFLKTSTPCKPQAQTVWLQFKTDP